MVNAARDDEVNKPSVSIIMACYNCERFIAESVRSVIDQDFQNWELIISDDGSTDKSSIIIENFVASDKRIRSIKSQKNRGAAQARNAALAICRGRYIAFLDSDDIWKPQKLTRQLDFMDRNSVAFSFSAYERISEEGQPLGLVTATSPVSYWKLLRRNVIGCLTAIYDSQVFGKVDMPDIAKRQDYGLWLALLKRVDQAVPLSESLALYRLRKSSISSNKIKAAYFTWRLLRDVEKLPIHLALYYFSHYAAQGLWDYYRLRR